MAPTEADLWKVYACKLSEIVLQGQQLGPDNRLYLPFLNQAGPLAGDSVPIPVTNFGVHDVGDTLVNVDNPLYTSSNEGYAQRCQRYLANVWLATDPSPGVKISLQKATAAMNDAMGAYVLVNTQCLAAWRASDEYKNKTMTQNDWIQANYPNWLTLKTAYEATSQNVAQLNAQINGPLAASLNSDISKVNSALGQFASACNMQAAEYIDGFGAPAGSTITSTTYVPKYNVDPAYGTNVTNWIAAATAKQTKTNISFNISESSNYDWKSLGFDSTKVDAQAWLPFFTAEYSVDGTQMKKEVKIEDNQSSVKVTLSGTGFTSASIKPDSTWNPGPIQKTYPTLADSAPRTLSDPMVLVNNIVVGYNVDTTFTLDKTTYGKITDIVNEASSHDASASATLFGFRLNLGGTNSVNNSLNTDWNDTKTSSDNFSITFPGRNDLVPKLIAVIGTVLK